MSEKLDELDLTRGLSIVIPHFNEMPDILRTITAAKDAAKTIDLPSEILVVDDGSRPDQQSELRNLAQGIKIVFLPHQGRVATTLAAIQNAKFENVLMLNARVALDQQSLNNLFQLNQENKKALFWNGDLSNKSTEIAHVGFWDTLMRIIWKKYYKNRVLTDFGIEDFDKYPKGSGMFVTRKDIWLKEFLPLYNYAKQSKVDISDDTRLLRNFLNYGNIFISPNFSGQYYPRVTWKKFFKNAFYRGKTSVDSYWNGSKLFKSLVRVIIPLTSLVAFLLLIFNFKLFAAMLFGVFLLIAIASKMTGNFFTRAVKDSIAGTPFLIVFISGFIYAYLIGFRDRLI